MKRILFLMAVLFAATMSAAEAQSDSGNVRLTTYTTQNCYTWENARQETVQMSPGELLMRSGKLRNTAIGVGLATGAASGVVMTLSATGQISDCIGGYIAGGVIAGVGFITALSLEIISNKLMKEAGARMTKMSIVGNGVVLKF